MPVIPKLQQIQEATEQKTINFSLSIEDGEVKEVPTMETPTEREMIKAEGLREVAILEDHQVVMIQMMVTTMREVEIMTPQTVMATRYQAAVTCIAH